MSEPIKSILIGAGQRGAEAYGSYAVLHPDKLRFIAVAEPDEKRRVTFAAQHHIPPERQFTSWEPLLAQPRLCQAALICTQDQQHAAPAMAAMHAGYDILLEKPMATTLEDCRALVATAKQTGRQLHICHLLRYTPHFQKMKEIIGSDILGQIVNVSHRENVSWWHMAHSFVRGNWAKKERSSPMILAKCCHDLDILIWLLDSRCLHLSSTGSLIYFKAENAPPGASSRCLNGCPIADTCPYYAPFIYIEMAPLWRSFADSATGIPRLAARLQTRRPWVIRALSHIYPALRQISAYRGWPRSVVALDPTPENLMEALKSGPYGRCVYHCDNDVVDNQAVLMQFENGISVTLTMHGHSHEEHRTTRIEGSRGTLKAHFGLGGSWIEVNEHKSDRRTHIDTSGGEGQGHGGGDYALLEAFLISLKNEAQYARTTAEQALESHLMAFAAEQARLEGRVIEMQEVRNR